MFINLLVVSITAILLLFVLCWLLSRSLRESVEFPKYAVAAWDDDRQK